MSQTMPEDYQVPRLFNAAGFHLIYVGTENPLNHPCPARWTLRQIASPQPPLPGSLDASPGCPPLGKGGNSFVGYPIFCIKIIPLNNSPPFQGGDRLTKRPASQSGAVAALRYDLKFSRIAPNTASMFSNTFSFSNRMILNPKFCKKAVLRLSYSILSSQ